MSHPLFLYSINFPQRSSTPAFSKASRIAVRCIRLRSPPALFLTSSALHQNSGLNQTFDSDSEF